MAKKGSTTLGLDENVEGLLAYLLGFITGILFYVLEKKSKFVRFHAIQSTITFIALWVVALVVAWIPFLGGLLAALVNLVALVLWILGMVKAYQGEKYKFPIVGDLAEKYI